MFRNRNSILSSAFLPVIAAMHLMPDDPAGGGGGAPPKPGKVETPPEPEKVTLTKAELEAQTNAAVESAIKRRDDVAKAQKEKDDAESARKKAEEEGKWRELADKEKSDREKADARAAAAERKAQVADVNIQVRDYLAADEARKPFLSNAPDIMLHVEKKLEADAKPADVAKLIETETAAFIERTGAKGAGAHGAPSGGARGKLAPGTKVTEPKNGDRARITGPARMF